MEATACQRKLPDGMIVDWKLNDKDGLELLNTLQSVPGYSEVRKIFCTNEIMVPGMSKARCLGADAFMMKPFDREVLIHKTREAGLNLNSKTLLKDCASGFRRIW